MMYLFNRMWQHARKLPVLAAAFSLLSVAVSFAQSAPPIMPDHTVYGRLGTGTGSGPGQAIPFATLASQLANFGQCPNATSSAFGCVKPDNTTISISGGIISAVPFISGAPNLVANGAMTYDQRHEGVISGTLSSPQNYFAADEWVAQLNSAGGATINVQQVTDAPAGFNNSAKFTVVNGAAPQAGDYLQFFQALYGPDMIGLGWGTSSALPVSLSFWVKSNQTGTFSCAIANSGTSPERTYVANFTISSANTWTFVSVPNILGDTVSSGTNNGWNTAAGDIWGFLGIAASAGSTFLGTTGWQTGDPVMSATGSQSLIMSTTGATFQITGVLLTQSTLVGNYPTNPLELLRLQRFYEKSYAIGTAPGTASTLANAVGFIAPTTVGGYQLRWKADKIAVPTDTVYSTVTGTSGEIRDNSAAADVSTALAETGKGTAGSFVSITTTAGHSYVFQYTSVSEASLVP